MIYTRNKVPRIQIVSLHSNTRWRCTLRITTSSCIHRSQTPTL